MHFGVAFHRGKSAVTRLPAVGRAARPVEGVEVIGHRPVERAVFLISENGMPDRAVVNRICIDGFRVIRAALFIARRVLDLERPAGETGNGDGEPVAARQPFDKAGDRIARGKSGFVILIDIIVERFIGDGHADREHGRLLPFGRRRRSDDLTRRVVNVILSACRERCNRAAAREGRHLGRACRRIGYVTRFRSPARLIRRDKIIREIHFIIAERKIGIILRQTVKADFLACIRTRHEFARSRVVFDGLTERIIRVGFIVPVIRNGVVPNLGAELVLRFGGKIGRQVHHVSELRILFYIAGRKINNVGNGVSAVRQSSFQILKIRLFVVVDFGFDSFNGEVKIMRFLIFFHPVVHDFLVHLFIRIVAENMNGDLRRAFSAAAPR